METALDAVTKHRSITDMLPGEMPVEDLAAIRRHVQREACGIRECTCAECGKNFVAYAEHKYRRSPNSKHGVRLYCSYTCYRVEERRMEADFREKAEKRATPATEERLYRLRHCRKKLAEAEKRKKKPGWEKRPYRERQPTLRAIAYWQAQLLIIEQEIEEEQKHDD